ncbi:MAG TPA: hypothetical protein DHV46_05250 [Desulfovibrio piger]|uniref:Uncharacterized protein n=2 Tax=Desulfovibrio piger TaxID=901 RepID=B6WRK8_9BACT|nr:hypothetical protein [Desulfovibrio piger]EEB34426.1 hypothetical protein DESPIG_00699 [Desulfovibrio piger ATCC 29098]HCZ43939.1 hypothetical protein [Desulfovibrio piger]
MMEMESAFDMLAEDPSGQGLKRLREELFEMRMDVKRAMDAGMTSDEMAVARRVMAAVDSAEKVAERVYDTLNR